MHLVDYLIIGAYLVFAIGVGLFFRNKAAQDSESFFLGGRSMPWWAICISMIATSFAADTPIWVTEVTRKDGLERIWWVIIAVLPLIVGIFLFSRLWRRAEIITDAQIYEMRYEGKPAIFLRGFRAFSSGVIQNLLTIGWVTFGMKTVITVLTPFNDIQALTVLMLVALFYAIFSGFYGVVVTDVVQFFITMGSMFALACIAVWKVGGMDFTLAQIAATPGYGEKTFSLFPDFSTFNADVLKIIVIFTLVWWSDASGYNMQRMSACRNEKDAIRATLFYALFQSCRVWLWVVVGLVSIVVFPALTEHSEAYPRVIQHYLGIGMRGLLITAFLAAFMSTIDTHLNWGASYLTMDFYKRFVKRDASPQHYVKVSKLFMILLMIGGCIVMLSLESVTEAMESISYMLACGGIVSVVRWFWWRVNAWTEITSVAGGLLGWAIYSIIPDQTEVFGMVWKDFPWEFKIGILMGVILPLSLIVTFATKPVSEAKLESFYRKVRPGGAWGAIKKRASRGDDTLRFSSIIDVLGGVMLCYGASLTTAYAILTNYKLSAIWLTVTLLGGFLVWRWYKEEKAQQNN
ncbi:MAG: sodium:solute symporter family protein [Verrucomicrobiota bacterium]